MSAAAQLSYVASDVEHLCHENRCGSACFAQAALHERANSIGSQRGQIGPSLRARTPLGVSHAYARSSLLLCAKAWGPERGVRLSLHCLGRFTL